MSDIPINLTSDLSPDERYLWDATGTPTQSTLAIETALSKLRYAGKPLVFTEVTHLPWHRRPLVRLAAVILIALGFVVFVLTGPKSRSTLRPGWNIAATTGNPSFGITGKVSKAPDMRLATDAASTATLQYLKGPKLQLSASSEAIMPGGGPEIFLTSGHANIEVPLDVQPAIVTTPAVACTLAPGCSAHIDSIDGTTQVRVDSGWAEVSSGKETLRLADSMACTTQPKSATIWPPYRISKDTSSNVLTKQIDNLLYGKNDEKSQYILLQELLKKAKPEDAALLWNLLPRLNESQREPVRNRLAKLVKNPPKGPAFDAVLNLDKDALDAWWNAIIGH